jgi:hypothetical protein
MITLRLLIPALLLFEVALLPNSNGFLPNYSLQRAANLALVARQMSLDNDKAISQIQDYYRLLGEKLHLGLKGEQDIDPIEFTEDLLKKASDMAALQRYHQELVISDAEKELRHAQQDHILADAYKQQAHGESVMAEEQAEELEHFEDPKSGYEEQERLRDMSVAHAAHRLEEDANEISIESQFKELEAAEKRDRACDVLQELERIEQELKETMKTLLEYKNEKAMAEWAKKDVIHAVKTKLNSIDHDPFKGDVAF